jgi:glucose/arabinose dehydrogenase
MDPVAAIDWFWHNSFGRNGMHKTIKLLIYLLPVVTFFPRNAAAQDSNYVVVSGSAVTSIYRPRLMEVTEERIRQLRLPSGFSISVFAEGLGHPRMMKVMPDGTVYVTDRTNGKLMMVRDANGDGKADMSRVLLQMDHLHGLDVFKGKLYLVAVKEIYEVELKVDGMLGKMKTIVSDLPDAGQHHNRTLKFGPDSMLYVSIGSTCNSCNETSDESAAMIRMSADGSNRKVYSKGLRNTIGFDWHPETRQLWGWDNGMDHLGDTIGREELNLLTDSGNYGWPYVYEKGLFEMHHSPRGETHEAYDAKTIHPVLLYDAHAASMEYMFYKGTMFPSLYFQSGFVAMHGSWNSSHPVGHNIVRVIYDKGGNPVGMEEFLSGFLVDNGTGRFGRPVGIAQYTDGSLLVSDDLNGIIYRITYNREEGRKRKTN